MAVFETNIFVFQVLNYMVFTLLRIKMRLVKKIKYPTSEILKCVNTVIKKNIYFDMRLIYRTVRPI